MKQFTNSVQNKKIGRSNIIHPLSKGKGKVDMSVHDYIQNNIFM